MLLVVTVRRRRAKRAQVGPPMFKYAIMSVGEANRLTSQIPDAA
jgi:hypothetical protein